MAASTVTSFLEHDPTTSFKPMSAMQARAVRDMRKKREAAMRGRAFLRATSRGEHLKRPRGKTHGPVHLESPARSERLRSHSRARPTSASYRSGSAVGARTPSRPNTARQAVTPSSRPGTTMSPRARKKGYNPWIEEAYAAKCESKNHPKKVATFMDRTKDGLPGFEKNQFIADGATNKPQPPCLKDFPTAPQCPGRHDAPITRGVPPDYAKASPGMMFSIVCNMCGAKDLQREPHYFHCAVCKFDLCSACKIGKKVKAAVEPPTPRPPPGRTGRTKQIPIEADAADTLQMTGASWADQQPQLAPVQVQSRARHPASAPTVEEADYMQPRDQACGRTANQKYRIGDEVEVGHHDNAALRGKRGVVVGKNRGRFGVDLRCGTPNGHGRGSRPPTPQTQVHSFLPCHLTAPGETTEGAPVPYQLGAGDVVELCHTNSHADGARARVTRVGTSGVDLDLKNFGEISVPVENVCFPMGSAVRVNQRGHILDGQRGRVAGYGGDGVKLHMHDDRIVDVTSEVLMSGARPDTPSCRSATPATPRTPMGGLPVTNTLLASALDDGSLARGGRKVLSGSHAPPRPSALHNTLLNSLRTALLHNNGHMTFVRLRRALGRHPPTVGGLKRVLGEVGLGELANDKTTLATVFRMFAREGGSVSSRPPTPSSDPPGKLDGDKLVATLRRRCPEKRARFIMKVFAALDKESQGYLNPGRVRKYLVTVQNPMAPAHFLTLERVPQSLFEEYYKDISAAMTSDEGFRKALTLSWKVKIDG